MYTIRYLINLACSIYEFLILIYCVLSWMNVADNKWTVMIKAAVVPALTPIKRFLDSKLPSSMRMIDFSPMVLLLFVSLAKRIILNIFSF